VYTALSYSFWSEKEAKVHLGVVKRTCSASGVIEHELVTWVFSKKTKTSSIRLGKTSKNRRKKSLKLQLQIDGNGPFTLEAARHYPPPLRGEKDLAEWEKDN